MEPEQELNMKFAMFEQQIQAIQQQLQAVEQAVVDLNSLNIGMEELIGKKDSEIMAPIGRGIFVKAMLLSEDLVVDIGGRNFVSKSIPDTQKLIQEQLEKLEQVRDELNGELDNINSDLTKTFMEHQKNLQGGNSECACGHEHCECEDGECSCGDGCGK